MVIRTYVDKDNTIIKNLLTNTGRNEIAQLYYGGSPNLTDYTRHLFYFDVVDLQTKYNNGELGNLSQVTHTLKMTNTSFFDEDLLAQKTCEGYQRACSFDLNLFRVNKEWDEGCGYDYTQVITQQNDEITYVEGASNWVSATSIVNWDEPGVYSGSPSGITVAYQHFDKGNENIEMDITDEVNSLITGGTLNYGYGLAFDRSLELLVKDQAQYVGFFTKQTQTYYEPFVESVYDNPIRDDRNSFYKGKTNKLYLYVNIGGQPTNLDNNPSVTIRDGDGVVYTAITTAQTTHVTKGVYSVEFSLPLSSDDCLIYTDTWGDLSVNGSSLSDVELSFEVRDNEAYFDIGTNETNAIDYYFNVSGIKRDERIKRGDQRKVFVSARKPFTTNVTDVIDGLEYRLYIREGNTEVNVIDWQDVNRSFTNNYFILDTSWMIPNIYHIDVKLTSNLEVKTYSDTMKFQIISQVDLH